MLLFSTLPHSKIEGKVTDNVKISLGVGPRIVSPCSSRLEGQVAPFSSAAFKGVFSEHAQLHRNQPSKGPEVRPGSQLSSRLLIETVGPLASGEGWIEKGRQIGRRGREEGSLFVTQDHFTHVTHGNVQETGRLQRALSTPTPTTPPAPQSPGFLEGPR